MSRRKWWPPPPPPAWWVRPVYTVTVGDVLFVVVAGLCAWRWGLLP